MATSPAPSATRYRWAAAGDVNAFFGLMLDNVMNLVILAGILIFVFGFPEDLVYRRMFPGTALGVMFGDLVYTWMAFRLAKKEGRSDVTAMPLGLDAPSTIGMAFTVLGPAYLAAKSRLPAHEAAI
jgi:AGZA family xanthine/uracil permease-like MFS transporter